MRLMPTTRSLPLPVPRPVPRPVLRMRAAMTLIEVLAVVVILGLLAVTLTVGLTGKIGKAKHEIARTQISQLVTQVQTFQLDRQQLPSSSEGLKSLTTDPKQPYYLEPDKLRDPWGHDYQFLVPGPNGHPFEILTLGADNRPGGTGEDADLSSAALGK
jgi:general secretion pathway protein G